VIYDYTYTQSRHRTVFLPQRTSLCSPFAPFRMMSIFVESGSNKLQVWVWHSPKPQKGASIVMPNKLHARVGTASAAEVDKMQYSSFFLRCLRSERSCHRFLLFLRITISRPLSWELPLHLMLPLYVINLLEVEGWCVSIWAPSLPGPSFAYVWSSVCCLFLHLPLPSVRFIGQVCAGRKTF
jgi:hypothetical protein